jgi:hypothetical protein
VTAKKSYGPSSLAEGISGISVTEPRRPSDHIPLERRRAFQWPVLNLRQEKKVRPKFPLSVFMTKAIRASAACYDCNPILGGGDDAVTRSH